MIWKPFKKLMGISNIMDEISDIRKEILVLLDEINRLSNYYTSLRNSLDELQGNYQHNVVPSLELARDSSITDSHEISVIKERLDKLEEHGLDDLVYPTDLVDGYEAVNVRRDSERGRQ